MYESHKYIIIGYPRVQTFPKINRFLERIIYHTKLEEQKLEGDSWWMWSFEGKIDVGQIGESKFLKEKSKGWCFYRGMLWIFKIGRLELPRFNPTIQGFFNNLEVEFIFNESDQIFTTNVHEYPNIWLEAILGFTHILRARDFKGRMIYHTKWEEWEYLDGDSWLMWLCWGKIQNLLLD